MCLKMTLKNSGVANVLKSLILVFFCLNAIMCSTDCEILLGRIRLWSCSSFPHEISPSEVRFATQLTVIITKFGYINASQCNFFVIFRNFSNFIPVLYW